MPILRGPFGRVIDWRSAYDNKRNTSIARVHEIACELHPKVKIDSAHELRKQVCRLIGFYLVLPTLRGYFRMMHQDILHENMSDSFDMSEFEKHLDDVVVNRMNSIGDGTFERYLNCNLVWLEVTHRNYRNSGNQCLKLTFRFMIDDRERSIFTSDVDFTTRSLEGARCVAPELIYDNVTSF